MTRTHGSQEISREVPRQRPYPKHPGMALAGFVRMPRRVTWGTKHWLHGMALLHTSVLRDHGDGDMPVASSRDCAMLTPCSTTFVLISKRDLSPAWGAGSAMARKHGESRASETQKQLREEQTSYSRLPKRAKTKTDLECYESHVASRRDEWSRCSSVPTNTHRDDGTER
ncbi:hypothetical protein ACCO45_006426 [Purpureocillium lilacinum]|uniref:Uncharacterized protein n=1 Tax=Purpureocillium lilacinum TaxID=33203 RepID=A0ACC4DPP5_PURLI